MAIDTRSEPDEDEDDGLQESTHNTPAPSPSPIALFIENNRRKEESLVVDKYSKNLKQKEPTNVAPGKKVAPKKNSAKESDADKNNPKKE
jgi:hypothetical protein